MKIFIGVGKACALATLSPLLYSIFYTDIFNEHQVCRSAKDAGVVYLRAPMRNLVWRDQGIGFSWWLARTADYLADNGVKVRYLHSDVDTVERVEILRDLRLGAFDVLVGINLLREGLDIPEVSLVAILDADKEGFLRSGRSLIQTIGRAARNLNGKAILYADQMTDSMKQAIGETDRRRARQTAHNLAKGITPVSIVKRIKEMIDGVYSDKTAKEELRAAKEAAATEVLSEKDLGKRIKLLEKQMLEHARNLEFEKAARVRDQLAALREQAFGAPGFDNVLAIVSAPRPGCP